MRLHSPISASAPRLWRCASFGLLLLWPAPSPAADPQPEIEPRAQHLLPWLPDIPEVREGVSPASPVLEAASAGGEWWEGFRPAGFNGIVRAAVEFRGELVVGGDFTSIGSVPAHKVARWDGVAWHDMGFLTSGTVTSLAVHENNLLVSGAFSRFQSGTFVLRFDGTEWTVIGNGLHHYFPVVTDIEVFEDMLLVAGQFFPTVARLDVTEWVPMVDGEGTDFVGFDSPAFSLTEFEGDLVAGGLFESYAGDTNITGVARWTGETWEPIGDSQGVLAPYLVAHNGNLYGGTNRSTSGVQEFQIFEWSGASWSTLSDRTGVLHSLASWDDKLLASIVGEDTPGEFVFHWDGTTWSPWPASTFGPVSVFLPRDNALFAAGGYRRAGMAWEWDGQTWKALADETGLGLDHVVHDLLEYDGMLIAGGYFQRAGSQEFAGVAKWDGSGWHPMGTGLPDGVLDLAILEGDLYAAGYFDGGPEEATFVARWDGDSWRGVGDISALTPSAPDRMVPFQGGLVVARTAITSSEAFIWNGIDWSRLALPIQAEGSDRIDLQAIGTYQDLLVVVVQLLDYDGGSIPDYHLLVYTWDGAEWTDLEYDLRPSKVVATHEADGRLYMGIDMLFGPQGVPYYDGVGWHELPFNPHVDQARAFTSLDGRLVAAGSFDYDWDASEILGLARLDGDTWTPLGNFRFGASLPRLEALHIFQGDLYVGGRFSQVDGAASNNIARLSNAMVPVRLLNLAAHRVAGGAEVVWKVTSSWDHAGFHVYRREGDARVRITDRLLSGKTQYRYLDPGAPADRTDYWLEEVSRSGETQWHGPIPLAAVAPRITVTASPNPFQGSTSIRFGLPVETEVTVRVFDLQGRRVNTLLEGAFLPAGEHPLNWGGGDEVGRALPAGVYFYVLETPEVRRTGRLIKLP